MISAILQRLFYTLPCSLADLTWFFDDSHRAGRSCLQMLARIARRDLWLNCAIRLDSSQPLRRAITARSESWPRGDWGRSLRYSSPVRPIVRSLPPARRIVTGPLAVCIANQHRHSRGVCLRARAASGRIARASFFTLLVSRSPLALVPILILVFRFEIDVWPVFGTRGITPCFSLPQLLARR